MIVPFAVDPAFEAGSLFVFDAPLCQVRLQDDARFPWLVLIPRIAGLSELDELDPGDRVRLLDDIVRAGDLVRSMGAAAGRPVQKLNVAALGNVTPQLHIHVVGRRHDDALWPDPVWGKGAAVVYDEASRRAMIAVVTSSLGG